MKAQLSQTLEILQRFNRAFIQHDAALLDGLIAEDCIMESVEPAPDGTRYVGRKACLEFWQKLANSREGKFADEDIVAAGEHGFIRWRYRFGHELSKSVRGVNVMRVRNGQIVEALGYVKTGEASVATAVRSAVE
ncbi:nuclear transport factor 2 family protein [Steroidobacter sp. S1-65]|uniref:Nuclear transport factor 2 family protein n=1 Tax=Steroidobacter gossypii TaxID=2805490 RepID=A0ABS1X3J9_9GAMM|nr:nuclear transport factor 2 family protein [Steroidobacter gossypii]MBM0107803.1 nuclear transport factor 2 family protein [Steroidobacter gossypii]